MKVTYPAADSLGVKSMCVHVKTDDCDVVIDPGIASEGENFPAPFKEKVRLHLKYKRKIEAAAKDARFIVITHYHWDHAVPERNESVYRGKILLAKNPNENINKHQRAGAARFFETIKGLPEEVRFADGKKFLFGKTQMKFSTVMWHGPREANSGYVIMVTVDDGKERLVYSSDVGGPCISECARYIIDEKPTILVLDGFPTSLLGRCTSVRNLKSAVENIIMIMEKTQAHTIVLDHHLLRDYRCGELYHEVYQAAERLGKKVCTVAELAGKEPAVLAGRKKYGPTVWEDCEKMTFRKLNAFVASADMAAVLSAKESLRKPQMPARKE